MDNEMIAELEKAYTLAAQYVNTTIRIRRLLSYSPVTFNNGQALRNKDTSGLLIAYVKRINNPLYPFVNPKLLVS